jgi:hypothetical protein
MWHTIRFEVEFLRPVKVGRRISGRSFRVKQFSKLRARVRPYIAETLTGPREMAEVDLEDGSTLLDVPMGYFEFLDDPDVPPASAR